MPTKKSKSAATNRSKSGSPKRKSRSKSAVIETPVDIQSDAAYLNGYYTCHNVAEFLDIRGFPWEGAKKGKKKKKKKKS